MPLNHTSWLIFEFQTVSHTHTRGRIVRVTSEHERVVLQLFLSVLPAMAADAGILTSTDSARPLSTIHLYYKDTYLFTNTAKVLSVSDADVDGKIRTTVVLDQTVMHPQGGQQGLAQLLRLISTILTPRGPTSGYRTDNESRWIREI